MGGDTNLYAYAAGRPHDLTDPTGTEFIAAAGGVLIGAYAGWAGATAQNGGFGQQITGALIGGTTGLIVGLLDPTGGVLTAQVVLKSALLAGGLGGWSNLFGQGVALAYSGRSLLCLNLGSAIGSTIGGAMGGAMGRVLAASPVMLEAAAGMHGAVGKIASQAMQAIGAPVSVFGELIGSTLWNRSRR